MQRIESTEDCSITSEVTQEQDIEIKGKRKNTMTDWNLHRVWREVGHEEVRNNENMVVSVDCSYREVEEFLELCSRENK